MNQKRKNADKGLSRRAFLKKSGGLAGGAGLMTAGLMAPLSAQAGPAPAKWDEQVDVIILGSGFAGLAAALEAHRAGASVMILEKMRVPGGNSIINGGVVAAAGSPKQQAEGIKDSPDLLYQDMLKAGLYLNHPRLARMVAEESWPIVKWTIDELGVRYMDKVVHLGGHSVPRSYSTYNRSGSAIVNAQLDKLKELGLKVNTGVYLTELAVDGQGRIVGIRARRGYRFPDEKSGKAVTIKANRAVVLATGGFGRDLSLRTIQDPKLTAKVDSTNHPGATGEALLQALAVGAMPVQVSWIQLGPWTSPDEKGFGIAPHFVAGAVFINGLMVDPATGKRFVNELANRKIRADAIINTGHPAVGITDALIAEAPSQKVVTDMNLAKGVVKKFDSLEALAANYKIPPEALKKTVADYNSFVRQGRDTEFGKYIRPGSPELSRPPFYSVRIWPKVHHTMGGIQINEQAQVLGLDAKPIPGLYAAGEVTGGIHGAVRLGSCATADCLIFGRIAGINAAREQVKS